MAREGHPKKIVVPGKHVNLSTRGGWEFVERKGISGIVGIVAVTNEDNLLLVEQYRPPMDKRVIELPAGLAGDVAGQEAEELANAARRELFEETGFEAAEMICLAAAASSAGITDEVVTLFLARGLKRIGPPMGDGGEEITLHEVPHGSVKQWLAAQTCAGRSVDMKVFAGLFFLAEELKNTAR